MSLDLPYTKIVLTVIATALSALAAQNAITLSRAEGQAAKVQICDEHACLRLSPIRKHSTVGGTFLTFGLPVWAEAEDR